MTGPRIALPSNALTRTEREVLTLLASGLSYKQIANRRGVSLGTVRVHTYAIHGKLDVRSTFEAAHYAWRNGIVDIHDAWNTLKEVAP